LGSASSEAKEEVFGRISRGSRLRRRYFMRIKLDQANEDKYDAQLENDEAFNEPPAEEVSISSKLDN
jgi:hypothetical protein